MKKLCLYPALAALALFMACEPEVIPDEDKEPEKEDIVDPKPEPPTPPVDEEKKEPSYDNLGAYDDLKNYVNRDLVPDFKLGAGVNVPSYLQQAQVYDLAVANFNEVTAGNAMKQSSVLRRDGSMDFTEVKRFIDLAEKSGMTVYGHTLAWHAQQSNDYLNDLIKGKKVEVPSGTGTESKLQTQRPTASC